MENKWDFNNNVKTLETKGIKPISYKFENLKTDYDSEIIECCFCGKPIMKTASNSTWGCWSPSEERSGLGEKNRCCNHCNESKVIPSRNQNFEQTGSYDDTSWWGVS